MSDPRRSIPPPPPPAGPGATAPSAAAPAVADHVPSATPATSPQTPTLDRPARSRRAGLGLSGRVGLIAGVAVAVAVVLTSAVIYVTTARTLRAELDRNLDQIATDVVREAVGGARGLRPGPRQDPFGGAAGLVQVLTSNGEVVAATGGVARLPVSDTARAIAMGDLRERRFESAEIADDGGDTQPMRIVTVPLDAGAHRGQASVELGALQVALPTIQEAATLARLRNLLVLVGLVGTGLAGLAGWWLGRRATRPVLELTTLAEDVRATGDLTRRLEVAGDDEVARLARTFNEMLGSIERMQESQSRLVADASHELRTPLTSLRTNIEVLGAFERLDPNDRADLLRDVRLQLDEFGDLVDSLVALTRDARADLAMAPLHLDDLVVEVTDGMRAFLPAERELVVDTVPVTVAGDEDTLARAVRNLVDNAVKYGKGPIEVAVTADGVVSVRDHGPGVAPEHRERIFDRFHRAPEARDLPGSGLGLAIVAQAAALHGGHVEVGDVPGGGALFRLFLPTA